MIKNFLFYYADSLRIVKLHEFDANSTEYGYLHVKFS